MNFESDGRVLLHGRDLNAKHTSVPLRDGTKCIVEATSNPADRYQTILAPKELQGVKGSDIPPGFEISIYRPIARTAGLDQLSVRNLASGAELSISVSYDFKDWSYRSNLIHFAEDLRALIELKLPKCTACRVSRNEYGADLYFEVQLDDQDDVYEAFARSDKSVSELHRETVAEADRLFITLLESRKTGEIETESGLKWWMRFVAVPLLSGGMGAAIVGVIVRSM
nr:hypothetical protein [Oceanococcus sp. HetDA_MAG_MS8]